MEITETLSDGLKREFQVTVPAADLEARADRAAGRTQGPRPVARLPARQGAGRPSRARSTASAVMAETIEALIRELNAKIVSERGLKLAMEPKVTIPNEETEVEASSAGSRISPTRWRSRCCRRSSSRDFKGIKLERMVHRGDRRRGRRGARSRSPSRTGRSRAKAEGAKVEIGDRVVIDFTGKIEWRAVRGRHRRRRRRQCRIGHLHSGLRGSAHRHGRRRDAAGEGHVSGATTPTPQLAGKEAEFEVTAKSSRGPGRRRGRR